MESRGILGGYRDTGYGIPDVWGNNGIWDIQNRLSGILNRKTVDFRMIQISG